MKSITGSNFIAGKQSKQGKSTYYSFNPQTHKQSSIAFHNATTAEINTAAKHAQTALHQLHEYDVEDIAVFLKEVSNQIYHLGDQLINTAQWETALPEKRLINERTRTCNQLELFSSYITKREYVEAVIDTKGNHDIRRMLIPIGPVIVFPPSNFPFAFGVCGGDTTSAFAAGCPVIVKAHPSHPQTSELFAHAIYHAITKTELPKEMFSLLHVNQPERIKDLIMHPYIAAIGFTGSQHVGRMIYDMACSRDKPIPVFAEMGSINPVFITKKAVQQKMNSLVTLLADSITVGDGQFCTKPGVIFIPHGEPTFVSKLVEQIKEKKPALLLNKKIAENYSNSIETLQKIRNLSTLFINDMSKQKKSPNALFITDSNTYKNENELRKEHFGPTSILVTYNTTEDLLQIIPEMKGELTGTIHADESEIPSLTPLINLLMRTVGRLIINGVPTGVEVCYAMHHGGPYPATTSPHYTSVGVYAIKRFMRPIAFQDIPDSLLPPPLQNKNHHSILRLVNQKYTRDDIR